MSNTGLYAVDSNELIPSPSRLGPWQSNFSWGDKAGGNTSALGKEHRVRRKHNAREQE